MKNQKIRFADFKFWRYGRFEKQKKRPKLIFRMILMKKIYDMFQTILRKKSLKLGKKCRDFFCWNTVECEPVPTRFLNPKACGVQGRSPGGGCAGTEPHTHKKNWEKRNDICFEHDFFFLKSNLLFSYNSQICIQKIFLLISFPQFEKKIPLEFFF